MSLSATKKWDRSSKFFSEICGSGGNCHYNSNSNDDSNCEQHNSGDDGKKLVFGDVDETE